MSSLPFFFFSFCLHGCKQDYTKTTEPIFIFKCGGWMGGGALMNQNPFKLGIGLDNGVDPG